MAQKKPYFIVGLFVTVGVLIGVAGVIWLGASKYFQKGFLYVTYFDESVQGLQVDSIVKYRGVDIGRVENIGVAPDQRLIEVVMKIDVKDFSVTGVVAKLSMAGITGIVYVDLDTRKTGEALKSPKIDFQPPYPVIPSVPSNIKQIEASINSILDAMNQIDFRGISNQLLHTARTIDGFVSGERMNKIMGNVRTTSENLAAVSQKMDRMMGDGKLDEAIADVRNTIHDAQALVGQIKAEIDSLKIGETAGRVNQAVEGTSKRVQSAAMEIERTAESLRHASESLEGLMDRLNADPSALIFSSPPPHRQKGE